MNAKFTIAIAFACLCGVAFASRPYAAPVAPLRYAERVNVPERGEASASAITNLAAAKASAAKIDAVNWDALNRYGLEIGKPLLAREYGPLTNLYAASLQPRSLVGVIEPGFSKDYYGNVVYNTGSSIGVAVI